MKEESFYPNEQDEKQQEQGLAFRWKSSGRAFIKKAFRSGRENTVRAEARRRKRAGRMHMTLQRRGIRTAATSNQCVRRAGGKRARDLALLP